ncbi:hypothetical protein GCWU000323_02585 [Leptotrichia hofstadii F0254]|uniref:Uncharacterized protein n=1 Tax=Leptotrichia hofstadii F0254 TaxID=634994 RepID=C9N164_9FUSO|nr:hypothetical protein GCWU000323_02585 [Leptotrichia hofstadii F0254]
MDFQIQMALTVLLFGKIRRKPFELGFAYQFLLFLQNPLPLVLFLQIYLFFPK